MGKKKKSSRQRKRERRLKQLQEEQRLTAGAASTPPAAPGNQIAKSDNITLSSPSTSPWNTSSSISSQSKSNHNHNSSSPGEKHEKVDTTAVKTFGSRKRTLAEVLFVYPRQNGNSVPYVFGKKILSSKQEELNDQRISVEKTTSVAVVKPRKVTNETLEDILNSNKRKKSSTAADEAVTEVSPPKASIPEHLSTSVQSTAEQTTVKAHDDSADNDDENLLLSKPTITRPRKGSIDYINESDLGHLSGRSVEDAVQDKIGCRPRSNSTDGELNLPRRGLCDERKVLESYKWGSNSSSSGSSSSSADNGNGAAFGRVNPRGFTNLGNTCYLNSTLQCLAYLPPFCQSLIALPSSGMNDSQKKMSPGKRVTMKLKSLFRQVHGVQNESGGNNFVTASSKGAIMPRSIVESVPTLGSCGNRKGYRFRPGRQEDAHEFLVHLLDAMHDGELREAGLNQHVSGWRDRLPIPRLDETTFVHRVFGGYLRSQVCCTKCGHCSNTYDPFLNLSLEVSRKSCTSIATALGEFTRKETLDTNNRWKCSGCKKHVCATKQLTVFRPPLSLCIQLKRFTYSGLVGGAFGYGGFGRGGSKISKAIEFPADLKLPLSDGRSCGYHLTGIVIHVGGSASSGHYTAYVKKPCSNEWFHMDDSYVEPVSERTVLRQRDAYLLFYSRKEVKLEFPTPPLRSSMSAKEAQELGRARAKARADSITSISKQQQQKELVKPVPIIKTDSSKPDGPSAPMIAIPHATQEDKVDGEFSKATFAQIDAHSVSSVDTSSSDSSGSPLPVDIDPSSPQTSEDESDDKNKSQESFHSGERIQVETSNCKNAEEWRENLEYRTEKNVEGCASVHDVPRVAETNVKAGQKAVKRHSNGDAPTEKSCVESENETSALSGSKVGSQPRTRIVLDRGDGKGRVEVMMGPRFRSKAWKPKTAVSNQGPEFALLGNQKVDAWDSDAEVTEQSAKQDPTRSKLLKQMERKEASRKRKMHLDRWDAALDVGKTKKIRKKENQIASNKNAFQQLQRQFQSRPGRAKGAQDFRK